jgi:hypothetical protein
MTTLHLSHKKMKNVDSKNMSKYCQKKNLKIKHQQIKSLLVKCIETFLIYIKDLNDVIFVNLYP